MMRSSSDTVSGSGNGRGSPLSVIVGMVKTQKKRGAVSDSNILRIAALFEFHLPVFGFHVRVNGALAADIERRKLQALQFLPAGRLGVKGHIWVDVKDDKITDISAEVVKSGPESIFLGTGGHVNRHPA